ncbi:MAG: menaquinone biosynthetic enzyme MqnA/MqnD family protein [Candidatus Rokuibacteriota bacterium]
MTRLPRVGSLPYLNSEPFFAHFEDVELVSMMPRALGDVMLRGELDAGLLSLADALALGDAVDLLPFGIATPGATGSVHVWSHRPLGALHGATIAVTGETSTSVRILKMLLAQRYGVKDVRWTALGADADAVLLIGDEALRRRGKPGPFACCTDLGTEWVEWTGLPAVFASWVIRRKLSDEVRASLTAAIDRALTCGLATLDTIAARRRDTGITEAEVVAYLRNFIFRFGPSEARAIAEFRLRLVPG